MFENNRTRVYRTRTIASSDMPGRSLSPFSVKSWRRTTQLGWRQGKRRPFALDFGIRTSNSTRGTRPWEKRVLCSLHKVAFNSPCSPGGNVKAYRGLNIDSGRNQPCQPKRGLARFYTRKTDFYHIVFSEIEYEFIPLDTNHLLPSVLQFLVFCLPIQHICIVQ